MHQSPLLMFLCLGPHFSCFGSYITISFMWNTYGLLSKVINTFVVIQISYIHLLSTNSVQLNVSVKNYNYRIYGPLVMSVGKIN